MTKHDPDRERITMTVFKNLCYAAVRKADPTDGDVTAEDLLKVMGQFVKLSGDEQSAATFWVAERMKASLFSFDVAKARSYQQLHDRITGKTRRKGAVGRPRRIER